MPAPGEKRTKIGYLFKKLVDGEIADVVYTGMHDSINDAIANSSTTPSINGANVEEHLNDKVPQDIQHKQAVLPLHLRIL